MAVESFFQGFVTLLDKWVIVVSLVTTLYLIYNFRYFYRKYIVGSYVLVLSLFTFWSIRNVFGGSTIVQSVPFLALSLLMDMVVVVFAASIIYHYEKWGDIAYVRKLFGLQRRDDVEIVEYRGPEVEELEPGRYYLVLEQGYSYEWNVFERLVDELPSLCFTRKHPEKLSHTTDLDDTTFYWLSESDPAPDTGENIRIIEPFRRGEMQETLIQFVKENKNPVILFDGLEYLIYKNSPKAIIELIQQLHDDLANRHDTTIIYSVDREGLSDDVFSVIKEEMDEVRIVQDDGSVEKKIF
jgi:uncharacterized protein YeeX (DUF496 family)